MTIKFAKINSENKVVDIICVSESDCLDNGVHSEQKGIDFLNTLFNDNNHYYKESSKEINEEVFPLKGERLAIINGTYDPINNWFVEEKPYNSWTLDNNGYWQSPVAKPTIESNSNLQVPNKYIDSWNDELLAWQARLINTETYQNITDQIYIWNPETSSWQ
jgi:hypothetical protein